MNDDIVIKVNRVYKDFVLPHERAGSVKGLFTSMFRQSTSKKESQHALKDISFEIKKGEFFGIVGRNGSGKSTLLKILAGIYQPTKGSISTKGKLVPFIELGVGFNPELTGRDNVYLNGSMLGFSENEINSMYNAIVEFAELERFMDQKLKNYSSGMQVRLAFSMAVRANADILLIDEVLAVGDADFQRKCFDYFKKLKKEKKTVIFVSHDMNSVREFCDRAALIEKNQLISIGLTSKITQSYTNLFMIDSGNEMHNKARTDNRQGSGNVIINDINLSKGVYTNDDDILQLSIKLKAHKNNNNLIAGFAVKNSQGQFINDSNTSEKGLELPSLGINESQSVIWRFPNIYEDGLYTIDLFVNGTNNEVYDRLDDGITFRVKRPYRTGSLTRLTVETIFKK